MLIPSVPMSVGSSVCTILFLDPRSKGPMWWGLSGSLSEKPQLECGSKDFLYFCTMIENKRLFFEKKS